MKTLKQFDRRDGILVNEWPCGTNACRDELQRLLPLYSDETGIQAMNDLVERLEFGGGLATVGFFYRIVSAERKAVTA